MKELPDAVKVKPVIGFAVPRTFNSATAVSDVVMVTPVIVFFYPNYNKITDYIEDV